MAFNLSNLIGKSWDAWDAPTAITDFVSQRKDEEGKDQAPEILPSLLDSNANTMELGTLPASLMPLFGSYPVDDIFSLVACQNCKYRFRTQTADHHTKNCLKKKHRKSPPESVSSRQWSLVDKGTKVPSAVMKIKAGSNHVISKDEFNDSGAIQRALSQSPKVVVQNLVPPLIIKREQATDSETAPTYKTQPIKSTMDTETTNTANYLPAPFTPLDLNLENNLSYKEGTSFPKKLQEVREKKIIPLKDRHFNPEEHCGVPNEVDGRPCTKSLTCKTHSIALRRKVEGRSFDLLLAAKKKAREKPKLDDGFSERRLSTSTSTDSAKLEPFDAFPFPSPLPSIPTPRGPPSLKEITNNRHLEVIKINDDAMCSRIPLTSLRIDSQVECEQRAVGFDRIRASDCGLGPDVYSHYIDAYRTQNQNDEMKSDEFEESWVAVPLERVKVPRPSQKSTSKKNRRILEQWEKGDITPLQLLEEGICQAKRVNEEKSPKKEALALSNLKLKSASPAKSPMDISKRIKFSATDTPGSLTRPRISLKLSRTIKTRPPGPLHSGIALKTAPRPDFKLPTPEKYRPLMKMSPKASILDTPGAGVPQPSREASLFAHKIRASATELAEAGGRNENLGSFEIAGRGFEDGNRNIPKVAGTAQIPGAARQAWPKQPRDMAPGAGQRSPHDGPVSDSELNNLLAAQFEDFDF